MRAALRQGLKVGRTSALLLVLLLLAALWDPWSLASLLSALVGVALLVRLGSIRALYRALLDSRLLLACWLLGIFGTLWGSIRVFLVLVEASAGPG